MRAAWKWLTLGMVLVVMTGWVLAAREPGMMKSDMSPRQQMWMRCRMMMRMHVENTDPAAVLAMKEKLNLTPEQVGGLEQVGRRARMDAGMVLTDAQKEMMKPMMEMPQTMMQMHEKMEKAEVKPGEKPVECPAMKMMKEKEGAADSPGMKMMRMRCDRMMNMKMDPMDPKSILGCKAKLMLTPRQVGQLAEIAEQARQDAAGILAPEQKEMLRPMAPGNMMDMHHRMMYEKMKSGEKMPECPVMKKMMEEPEPSETPEPMPTP